MAKRYAVIMAGGAGTRLWPLSRRGHPKQLMRLFDGKSLLRLSYERVARLLPASQIHVIAGRRTATSFAPNSPNCPMRTCLASRWGAIRPTRWAWPQPSCDIAIRMRSWESSLRTI